MIEGVTEWYGNTHTVMGVAMGEVEATYSASTAVTFAMKKVRTPSPKTWTTTKDNNFVGNLANKLGDVVDAVNQYFSFYNGSGDVDIVTSGMYIEVKSGAKMKLTQSAKNKEYAAYKGNCMGFTCPRLLLPKLGKLIKKG